MVSNISLLLKWSDTNVTIVCYPPHGLGPSGVRAILSFFEDDDDSGKL